MDEDDLETSYSAADNEDNDIDEAVFPSGEEEIEQQRQKVLSYIKDLTMTLISSLADGKPPILTLKSIKNPNISRQIQLINTNSISVKKFVLYFKLLEVVQNLIEKNQFSTKRDIYYQFKHMFKREDTLDRIINDVSRTIGVPRISLNILATPHGLVSGDLDYYLSDRVHINCRIDKNGTIIPNQTFTIRRFQSNALFVIIVEKHATFMRLIDDNFLEKYPAILITGKGEPDICTRHFCHLLWTEFSTRMKFFCLTDANPFGIQIMKTYKYGSKQLVYMNSSLNLPGLKWIGLKLSDLDRFKIENRNEFITSLNESDIKLGRNLLKRLTDLQEFDLTNELEFMLKSNSKTDLQYLQNLHNSYLCDVYLRAKLDNFLQLHKFEFEFK